MKTNIEKRSVVWNNTFLCETFLDKWMQHRYYKISSIKNITIFPLYKKRFLPVY